MGEGLRLLTEAVHLSLSEYRILKVLRIGSLPNRSLARRAIQGTTPLRTFKKTTFG